MADDAGEPNKPKVIAPEEWERMGTDEKWETTLRFEGFQSPILPPEVLKSYGNVVPGLDRKLIQWSEEETRHRRTLEREAFDEAKALRDRASKLGPAVAILGLACSVLVSSINQSWAGAAVATVIAIVSVGGPFAARLLANRWAFKNDD